MKKGRTKVFFPLLPALLPHPLAPHYYIPPPLHPLDPGEYFNFLRRVDCSVPGFAPGWLLPKFHELR